MEHFKEVPDVNRLIISPLYLREGLEFAKNQGYNDILISTDDIGISGVSCKHTLNVSLICEYDFIETLIISGYDFTIYGPLHTIKYPAPHPYLPAIPLYIMYHPPLP